MDATTSKVDPAVDIYYDTKEELLKNGIFPLKGLANELVTHILHQLSYQQIVAVGRVCKPWKAMSLGLCSKVTRVAIVPESVDLQDVNNLCIVPSHAFNREDVVVIPDNNNESWKAAANWIKNLPSLKCVFVHPQCSNLFDVQCLSEFQLEHIDMDKRLYGIDINHAFDKTKLTCLSINQFGRLEQQIFALSCPLLKFISAKNSDGVFFTQLLKNGLIGIKANLPGASVDLVIAHSSRVEKLSIGYDTHNEAIDDFFSDEEMKRICQFKYLKDFKCGGSASRLAMLVGLERLESLEWNDKNQGTTAVMIRDALEPFGHRLKKLIFSGRYSKNHVEVIVSCCPNLRTLGITNRADSNPNSNDYVDGTMLYKIAKLKYLRTLIITFFDFDEDIFRSCLSQMKNLRYFYGSLPSTSNRFEFKYQQNVRAYIPVLQREFPHVVFAIESYVQDF